MSSYFHQVLGETFFCQRMEHNADFTLCWPPLKFEWFCMLLRCIKLLNYLATAQQLKHTHQAERIAIWGVLKTPYSTFFQNAKKKQAHGSISGFTCNQCKRGSCCWSTAGKCPCNFDVVGNNTKFCFGCKESQSTTSAVSDYNKNYLYIWQRVTL